jgi:hypothetical protein
MKPAANTSVSDQKTIQPTKTGALIWNLKNTATAFVAAIWLASSVNAQEPGVLTLSGPTLSTTTGYVTQATTIPWVNTRLNTTRWVVDTPVIGSSIFTVDITGPVTLNIAWDSILGNWDAPDDTNGSSGYMGTTNSYDVNMRFQFGLVWGSMSDIQIFDDWVTHPNTGINEVSAAEWFKFWPQHFSKDINITTPWTYAFAAQIESINGAGFGDVKNLTFTLTANSLDINTNGLPDKWEYDNFGMLTPAGGNPDGDDLTNMQEYAFGTNPTQSNPSPIQYSFETKQGEQYLTMIVPRNTEATNMTYSAQVSSDLTHWSPLVAEVENATFLKFQALIPVSRAPQQFLRAGVGPK